MEWIQQIVDRVFEGVPYNKETQDLRQALVLRLTEEADKRREAGTPEHQIIGGLISDYGSFDAACALLGVEYTSDADAAPVEENEAKKMRPSAALGIPAAFLSGLLRWAAPRPSLWGMIITTACPSNTRASA